jgi:hypothetical protein
MCAVPGLMARRADIEWRLRAAREVGSRVLMVTLTVSHSLCDPLDGTLLLLEGAYDRLLNAGGRGAALRGELGILGIDRTVEVDYTEHGYHPHYHLLVFLQPGSRTREKEAERLLTVAWGEAILTTAEVIGVRAALPDQGVVARSVEHDDVAARYMTKLPVGPKGPNGMFVALVRMLEHDEGQCRCDRCSRWYMRWREFIAVMEGTQRKRFSSGVLDARLKALGAAPSERNKPRRKRKHSGPGETRR